jgi:hypothetical protein
MEQAQRDHLHGRWKQAVIRSLGWAEELKE